MQRKPGYPAANCSIKMPDCSSMPESMVNDDEQEQQQRRLQLINFGHAQWGFNNWSWSVTKQDLDFVDFTNGKYCAGVVAFVSITVKSFDIHRENIGYATSVANTKGFAIYKSRKCAVTNALRETLLSFGGNVSTELCELLDGRDTVRESVPPANAQLENNQNVPNIPPIPTLPNMPAVANAPVNKPGEMSPLKRRDNPRPPMPVKNAPPPPPQPQPMPPHSAVRLPRPTPRPNSNVSFVLQPVVGAPLYAQRLPPPYYECGGAWHFAYDYERPANLNVNFNVPPKNLAMGGREYRPCRDEPPPQQACWIKPTIFYDGFWTEQKVKKWVAEQVEKQFPEEPRASPSQPDPPAHG